MGAVDFRVSVSGTTAAAAFAAAVERALQSEGRRGYTGTIAEKHSFAMIQLPAGVKPLDYVERLLEDGDPRIDDKWGPAGCIDLGDDPRQPGQRRYLFFGYASF